MKYMISEKQLSNLILKQQVSDDLEYDHVSDADPSKDDFVIGQEVDVEIRIPFGQPACPSVAIE